MRTILFAVSVILATNLVGCFMECPGLPPERIEDKEVYGTYCANFGDADRDCIELLADSLYVHFYADTQACHIDSAGWRYIRDTLHYPKAGFSDFTAYHPRERGILVPVPLTDGDTSMIKVMDRCYEPTPEGVVDITPRDLSMSLRKDGRQIQLLYCWKQFENYIKVDSATAEEVREEMRQCLTKE